MNTKIMVLVGTRPEAIKTAPVVRTFRQWGLGNYLLLVNTGQHQQLQQPFGELFGVEPDYDLGISSKGLPLAELLARTLAGLQTLLNHLTAHGTHIECLMAQGDTNTVLATCLTAQLNRVPFAHLESGLRSHNFAEPFPEEYNRRVAALNATVHFAPTPAARDNLLREGVERERIVLTGNTGVDALRFIASQERPETVPGDLGAIVAGGNLVLVTCHRRENWGDRMRRVLEAVTHLAGAYPLLQFLWIQHPNSADALDRYTKGHLPRNFRFWPPVGYLELLTLYRACRLVISDSGGVQEEAPDFGLPVLVTRSVTERPEGIALGCAELTGAEPDRIIHAFHRKIREKVTLRGNPYGDGKAAGRIMEWFLEHQLPVPEFSTVFVGGGPAGTGPLICALQTGRLERLLERKIALVEASGDLGKGTIGNYIVNSDTLVDVFLECLAGEAGQKLSETRQSAEAQALYEYAGQHIPLSMVSTYLAALGRDLERLVTAHPGSQVFQHTRVDVIRVLESGKCLVHAVDTGGHTPAGQQAFLAHSVVLATGGRQDRETVLDACITPSIRLRGFAGKVLTTDHLLTEAGVKEAEAMLRATSRTRSEAPA